MIGQKKAAIELSISTVVIIVLAMTMLILGLVLVRSIFSSATGSVDVLDQKVKDQLTSLFTDESQNVVVKLGSDFTAKIKPDSGVFGIAVAAQTLDGSSTNRNRLKYKLTLDAPTSSNCAKVLGNSKTEALIQTPMNQYNSFDSFSGAQSYARVLINIPKGTQVCTQKVFVDVKDFESNKDIGGSFFIIDIQNPSFFG
ncbi:MAG: hypothetical protein WCK90_06335 [archaeon]